VSDKSVKYYFAKRLFDITFSFLFIILSFPLQVGIFILLIFELKEFPVFFQKRGLTLEKPLFRIIKFKTLKSLPQNNTSEHNIFLKTKLEKYIGPISRILRKTGLDELPQLYNVFFGSMSLIGPRPLMVSDLKIMRAQFPNHYRIRSQLNSKPGLSGIWQLFGNREEGIENLLELEPLYEVNRSIALDFKLLFYTFAAILLERNSDAILANKQKQTQTKIPAEFTISQGKTKLHLFRKGSYDFIKNLKRADSYYSIELPDNYWNTATTIDHDGKNDSSKSHLKIVKIDKKSAS
jgi:lipopolysaccharide/colanic/teichoic acid biosynthesis glycosyltransferase